MKFKELKENEALMMNNVSLHVDVPGVIGKDEKELSKIELERVKMILFTDAKNVRKMKLLLKVLSNMLLMVKNMTMM